LGTCQEDAIMGVIIFTLVAVPQMEATRQWTWLNIQAM
jgi:hypothetical protein